LIAFSEYRRPGRAALRVAEDLFEQAAEVTGFAEGDEPAEGAFAVAGRRALAQPGAGAAFPPRCFSAVVHIPGFGGLAR
jgi:hypothetical protein